MLELDLGFRHSGVSTIIIAKVDNAIANTLLGAELPVVVVTRDYVSVITRCQATGWWQVRGNNFRFRNRSGDNSWVESDFIWSPNLFHLNVQKKRSRIKEIVPLPDHSRNCSFVTCQKLSNFEQADLNLIYIY